MTTGITLGILDNDHFWSRKPCTCKTHVLDIILIIVQASIRTLISLTIQLPHHHDP